MISVVMPSRNETMLQETIRSMRAGGADEIVVIDDGSIPPVDLAPEPDVVVERVDRSKGPSFCRNRGGQLARGDIVIYSDAHVTVPPGGLLRLAELAYANDTIVCSAIKPLVSERNWTGLGGVLVEIGAGYDVKYRRKESSPPATGYIGSVYAGTRKCWDDILWWPETSSWGYNEQCLSLAVLFAGKMPVVASEIVCLHAFKKKFNYPVQLSSTRVNRLLAHYQLFEDFETRWLPVFRREFRGETALFEKMLKENGPYWKALREKRLAHRKLTDTQVYDIIAAWDKTADPGFSANRRLDTPKDEARPDGTVCLFTAFAKGREANLTKWIRHAEASGYPIDGRIFMLDNPRPDVESYARSCGALVFTRPPLPSADALNICEHLAGH
jgi:glycosyltransferase involved in cell wall biosynthesis